MRLTDVGTVIRIKEGRREHFSADSSLAQTQLNWETALYVSYQLKGTGIQRVGMGFVREGKGEYRVS